MRFTKRNTISRNKNLQIDQTYKQKSGFKPNGLWYSYYSSWYKWILENELYVRLYKYIHHIGIANKSLTNIYEQDYNKILVIKNTTDFDIFHNKYKIKMKTYDCINWKKVSIDYGGIEFVPYLLERRKIDWYYTFDIAGGCIWNNKIIKEIKLIYEKVGNDYKKV
jgi:hypothetical protein